MNDTSLQPAVFLDRDGTLIREVGYLARPEQLEILAGVPAALRALHDAGFKTVLVTNQSAVARGWLSESSLQEIHRLLQERLTVEGAILDGIYYCPHHPSEGVGAYRCACDCRKPQPGMILRAAEELALAPNRSYVVGDQDVDLALAQGVGATPVMVRSNGDRALVNYEPIFDNLKSAVDWILSQGNKG